MEQPQDATNGGQPPLSFVQKLRNGERYWSYKSGLRIVLCVIMLIGIGTSAWLVATAYSSWRESYYIVGMDAAIMPFVLAIVSTLSETSDAQALPMIDNIVQVSLSFIWSLVGILVPLLRKTHRPVHPGTAVAFDLLLWLALIATGLFTIVCIYELSYYGAGDTIDDNDYSSNYSGHYKLLSNGTWVWKLDYVSPSYTDPTYHYNSSSGHYNYIPGHNASDIKRNCGVNGCANEDALVNRLWHEKQQREKIQIVTAAVQFLGVILHFTLFVWACVDTHRRNHNDKVGAMRTAADGALRDMQARGLITIHDPALAGGAVGGGAMRQVGEGEAGPSGQRQHVPG